MGQRLEPGHWKKYGWPEETPGLVIQSIDEIDMSLREQFPEVFRTARLRERLRDQVRDGLLNASF